MVPRGATWCQNYISIHSAQGAKTGPVLAPCIGTISSMFMVLKRKHVLAPYGAKTGPVLAPWHHMVPMVPMVPHGAKTGHPITA